MPRLNDDSLPKLPDNFQLGTSKLAKAQPQPAQSEDEEMRDLLEKIERAKQLREEKMAKVEEVKKKVEERQEAEKKAIEELEKEPVEPTTVSLEEPTQEMTVLERTLLVQDQRITAIEAALFRLRGAI